jgi:hypothetical protein
MEISTQSIQVSMPSTCAWDSKGKKSKKRKLKSPRAMQGKPIKLDEVIMFPN